jgi:GTPase SAR1 family protein
MVVATKKKEEVQVVVEKPAKKLSNLKAIVPEKIEKRLKLFLYGPSGLGKTTAALQFPSAYVIDCERGAEDYAGTIAKSGSVLFQSGDFNDIKGEVEKLLTEDHPYKTLIIDPITIIYQSIQDLWTKRFQQDAVEKNKGGNADLNDFGMRFWGKVKSDYKSLQRLILKLDMNVIVTAHMKDIYGNNFNKIGVAPDSMRGDDYFFDLVFRMEKRGKDRYAITEKERAEIGKNRFPEEFIWSYENFKKFYGSEIIERTAKPVAMATKAQIDQITGLLETVKVDQDWVDKVMTKADADDWHEFTFEQIQKCIDFLLKKLNGVKN